MSNPTDKGSFLLERIAGYKIRRLHGLMQAGWTAWFARFDLTLTPMQGGMLLLVDEHRGLSQMALAGLLGIEPPTLSQAIGPLLNQGLIERRRVEGDRRAYALHVTASGAERAALIRKEAPEHERQVLAGLSPEEQAELHRLLDKALRAHAVPDSAVA